MIIDETYPVQVRVGTLSPGENCKCDERTYLVLEQQGRRAMVLLADLETGAQRVLPEDSEVEPRAITAQSSPVWPAGGGQFEPLADSSPNGLRIQRRV